MAAMQVFRGIAEARSLRGCAVAIGNFDGVHLGHRRLFALALELAAARDAPAAALTFDPHPARILKPALAPPLLTPLGRKLELFSEQGLDAAVVQSFDTAYAQSSAAEFVERDLLGHLGAAEVVVGWDFTAGHERARVESLRTLLSARGMALHVVDPVSIDGLTVSSTKIREFLLEGNVEAAAQLLARPHDVEGVTERGAGRGRRIGFPTANLRTEGMLPASGVYVVRALVTEQGGGSLPPPLTPPRSGGRSPPALARSTGAGESSSRATTLGSGGSGAIRRVHDGVCNVGVKPTVQEGGPLGAEVHLLDFDGRNLHGAQLRLSFLRRIRDERRFASLDALRAQIAEDVRRAREVLRQGSPV
jgi:riboflavin kinase/FMN adenylyltransferase